MILRLIFALILLVSISFLPWWVNLILIVVGSFYFKNFYEAVLIGLIMDSLYGSSVVFETFIYFYTLTFLISVFLINKIREKMIMY
jgi:hypothetical protein